ncbi:YybH family protein [Actinomadura luteofluorescens]|uniref:YybH family protein n=1 Tax=Actinomadura luteofluorescens TaxID=46163 RepID=UPI00364481A9
MRPLAERPEDVPHVFADRFNGGDPAAVAAVYEEGAVFVPEPGTPLTGADAHAANARFMALGLPIKVSPRHVYSAATSPC